MPVEFEAPQLQLVVAVENDIDAVLEQLFAIHLFAIDFANVFNSRIDHRHPRRVGAEHLDHALRAAKQEELFVAEDFEARGSVDILRY